MFTVEIHAEANGSNRRCQYLAKTVSWKFVRTTSRVLALIEIVSVEVEPLPLLLLFNINPHLRYLWLASVNYRQETDVDKFKKKKERRLDVALLTVDWVTRRLTSTATLTEISKT